MVAGVQRDLKDCCVIELDALDALDALLLAGPKPEDVDELEVPDEGSLRSGLEVWK